MALPALPDLRDWRQSLRERARDKAIGAVAAVLLEALLLLLLVSFGVIAPNRQAPMATVTFDARDYSETPPAPKPEPEKKSEPAAAAPQAVQHQTETSPVEVPAPKPPAAVLPVLPRSAPSFDLANVPTRPKAPPGPAYGPAFTPVFGDSKRVGTAPNGQPMYAASWYREPTDQELAGYLSTASGPGWGLITCKTVADYRVEDCVGLDEYPEGSHMLRAVLAASWQFRVRPPRVNGVSQVGDWVRIRIEYDLRPAGNPYEGR